MIIAVDGPAASGKGTLAKGLARHYGLPHLDTGLLYRAVGPRGAAIRRRARISTPARSPPRRALDYDDLDAEILAGPGMGAARQQGRR